MYLFKEFSTDSYNPKGMKIPQFSGENIMNNSSRTEEGQGLVEYALILVLVAVVVIAILTILGPQVVVVYARVMGGFSGQSVTMSGNEVIVIGADITMKQMGGGVCNLKVAGTALVGLQDGKIKTNQTVSARAVVNGIPTSATLSATANGNGIADLGSSSAIDTGVDCGTVSFVP
jgi:pilus assembly protein Flp/PilA